MYWEKSIQEQEMDRDIRRCAFHSVVSAMAFLNVKWDLVLQTS